MSSLTSFLSSSGILARVTSIFSSPISLIISFCIAHNSLTASCPNIKASNISSSLTCLEPLSTILIASIVPATVKLIVLLSISSQVGLILSSPSILPTITPATGPSNGILEIPKHNDVPNNAVISGVLSGSTLSTVFTTCTSFLKFSLNIGLIGLSITLAVKVAASVGRPSLLINPPGILPTEYNFS